MTPSRGTVVQATQREQGANESRVAPDGEMARLDPEIAALKDEQRALASQLAAHREAVEQDTATIAPEGRMN